MSVKALDRLAGALRLSQSEHRRLLALAIPTFRRLDEPAMTRSSPLNVGLWPGYELSHSSDAAFSKVATALWTIRSVSESQLEVTVPEDSYLFCLHLRGSTQWSAAVGDLRVERPIVAGTLNMGFQGDRASIEYSNADLLALHVYVSRLMFEAYVRDAGLQAVEFIDPANRRDLGLVAIGARMAAAMGQNSSTTRLRIEGLALLLLSNVVERWSNCSPPAIDDDSNKSDPKRLRDVLDFLDANADCVGLVDIAYAADLPLHVVPPWF